MRAPSRRGAFVAAALLAAAAAGPMQCVAQPAPAAAPTASVSHSAANGITLKIGSALKKILIFSAGTGSVAAGGALTVITTASSYAIYVANEYLWDHYAPPANATAASFDASSSFWRNTKKYLTLKPVGMAATWSLIYAYTGSWTTTLAMGSASSLAGPLVFYANNMAWDWYDWYSGAAKATAPASPAPAQQRSPPTLANRSSTGMALHGQQ